MTAELIGVTIGIGTDYARLAERAAGLMCRLAQMPIRILGRQELERTGVADPNHLKFRLFDLVDAENVLYFDADAFCLRRWEPRRWLNRPEWVAVRGFWFDPRVERLGQLYGFGADTFNSGWFLINRTHHDRVLRLAEALQPSDGVFHGLKNPDEIALAAALKILRVSVRFLDRRFNWIQYGHGDLAARAGVIVAHACHSELRRRYLSTEPLSSLCAEEDADADADRDLKFADKTFLYKRVGYDCRPLLLREDGTIGEGGGDAERYYYGYRSDGVDQLVLGSALEETCTLLKECDGVWRGRWSRHERMPVTLTRHRGQVLLDLLTSKYTSGRSLVGVEIGVDRGETSAILLRGRADLHLYLIDPWRATAADAVRQQEGCDAAMVRAEEVTAFAAGRRMLIACDHAQAASYVPDGMDMVFLDADHGYEATLAAIATWWPKLSPGGCMTGHDYGHPDYPGVQRAVEEFARRHGLIVRRAEDDVWYYEEPS